MPVQPASIVEIRLKTNLTNCGRIVYQLHVGLIKHLHQHAVKPLLFGFCAVVIHAFACIGLTVSSA